ncbi:DNA-directed DNA polymerase [Tanacetum coccineum]
MITYLKNIEGWKHKDLKSKDFDSIKELFDKALKRVDDVQEIAEVDNDQEASKIKELMKIVSDEEEVAIDAIPLSVKPPSIMYLVFSHMLKSFDREDLETLWKLVKAKHGLTRPEEGYERVLWGDLKVGCELRKGPHYTKDCPLKKEGKALEEAYYTQFGVPFQQGGQYRAAAPGFYQINNVNPLYQERRQSMEESLIKFINLSAKRHEENSNLVKEIRASIDAAIRNQGASIKALEIQIRQISKVLQEKGSGSLPSSTETNLRDHVNSISTTVKTDITPIRRIGSTRYAVSANRTLVDRIVKHPKGIAENVLVGIGKFIFPIDFIILDMPEDVNVPLILERPFLSTAYAKVDVFKRKITLRVGDENIIFRSVKTTSSLIKRVYMLSLRERMDLNLEARLIRETLILNRPFDPLCGDYIEQNDLNEPQELRRNRVDDLEPTVEEGEVVNDPMIDIVKTRCDFIGGLDDYPIKDMDPYLDEGMGDVIVGEPFCKALYIEARRFDGIITIYDGDDSVT